MEIKKKLYAYCLHEVRQRIERIRSEIEKVQTSANQETKSSAGDKYETGRAMAQQEVELNRRQLVEAERLEVTLLAMTLPTSNGIAAPGSLVTTSNGVFFLAISIGPIQLDKNQYFVISPESPVGKMLMGKKPGARVSWNDKEYIIQSID